MNNIENQSDQEAEKANLSQKPRATNIASVFVSLIDIDIKVVMNLASPFHTTIDIFRKQRDGLEIKLNVGKVNNWMDSKIVSMGWTVDCNRHSSFQIISDCDMNFWWSNIQCFTSRYERGK